MRKYFTWRCVRLHVLVLVLVPLFLVAGWWQYHVALGGNDLSWVYTVEWPLFAVYALYVWWRLIHDRSTPFDRLWAAKQRAAADEEGRPLHQIPGWAMDKDLSRAVTEASAEAARALAQSHEDVAALGSHAGMPVPGASSQRPGNGPGERDALAERSLPATAAGDRAVPDTTGGDDAAIDARVLEVKTVVDEEMEAYNRYLADLWLRDPPKRWRAPRRGASREPTTSATGGAPPHPAELSPESRPELGPGDDDVDRASGGHVVDDVSRRS
jgi:hypothetical protein